MSLSQSEPASTVTDTRSPIACESHAGQSASVGGTVEAATAPPALSLSLMPSSAASLGAAGIVEGAPSFIEAVDSVARSSGAASAVEGTSSFFEAVDGVAGSSGAASAAEGASSFFEAVDSVARSSGAASAVEGASAFFEAVDGVAGSSGAASAAEGVSSSFEAVDSVAGSLVILPVYQLHLQKRARALTHYDLTVEWQRAVPLQGRP
jgi:hypothetical protein